MAGSLVVLARQSPLNGGTTVAGAQLFVYDAGGTTKRAIYTTSALAVQHSNPVVADANGRLAAIWLDPAGGSYKLVLATSGDTDPPASPIWTDDNIPTELDDDALSSNVPLLDAANAFTATQTMTGLLIPAAQNSHIRLGSSDSGDPADRFYIDYAGSSALLRLMFFDDSAGTFDTFFSYHTTTGVVTIDGVIINSGTPQTLTGAGAVNLTTTTTLLVTTGANALTLADGTEGQHKYIVMKTDGGAGTLTPTNLYNGTTLTFDDVGDSAHLFFTDGQWVFMGGTATLA